MFKDIIKLPIISVIIFILLLLIGCFILTSCNSNKKTEPIITEYEVLSVHQYVENITNGFGGVKDINICYYFTYVDEKGNLKEEKSFENLKNGYTKVIIGDTNKYVIEKRGSSTYKNLYLTKETLQNIELNSN